MAFTFFKPAKLEDGKLSGQTFKPETNGCPTLHDAIAAMECSVREIVEIGDHHILVGEVVEAYVLQPIEGRPDAAILEMKDLGDNVFYGGCWLRFRVSVSWGWAEMRGFLVSVAMLFFGSATA